MVHHRDSAAKEWTSGTTCQVCMQDFHVHSRLSTHYKRQPRCLHRVMAFFPKPEVAEHDGQNDVTRRTALRAMGLAVTHSDCPPSKVFGPAIP